MTKEKLMPDFSRWLKANTGKPFDELDYLYGKCVEQSITPDIFLAFAHFFRPSFVLVNGMLLLKDSAYKQSADDFNLMNSREKECWINLCTLSYIFPNFSCHQILHLARIMKASWEDCINREFRSEDVLVEILDDFENSEISITACHRPFPWNKSVIHEMPR